MLVNRTHKRIDRERWAWTAEDIVADAYADSHSLRPYGAHRQEIDRLVTFLTQMRGLSQILYKRG
jgi:hypothetical protein